MKLGEVLRKERKKRDVEVTAMATHLGVPLEDYEAMEAGDSPAEIWGPRLAQIAITLETPTSRLLAESGRSEDTRPGQAGERIRGYREDQGRSVEEMAQALGIEADEYGTVEAGESPIETYGPRLLAFAERVEQPVFNLFYPCGLPFQELDDYP